MSATLTPTALTPTALTATALRGMMPTSITLTPSEIVMLRGTDFAPAGRLGFGERVPGTDAKVSAHDWMRAAWRAATAAVVGAGDVRLTPTATTHLFGLLTSRSVRAERAAGTGAWPAGSLEAQLVAAIDPAPVKLADVYVALLGQTTRDTDGMGIVVARRGLFARGLLESRDTTVLRVVPSTEIVVPPATVALMREVAIAPVQALARTGGAIAPATWALVEAALTRAIKLRTKPPRAND